MTSGRWNSGTVAHKPPLEAHNNRQNIVVWLTVAYKRSIRTTLVVGASVYTKYTGLRVYSENNHLPQPLR